MGHKMRFRNRLQDPKAMRSMGAALLAIAIVWPMLFHPAAGVALNLIHGVRGMLFGLSIALNLLAFRLTARRRSCGTD